IPDLTPIKLSHASPRSVPSKIFETPMRICSFNARGSTSTNAQPFKPTAIANLSKRFDILCLQEVSIIPSIHDRHFVCDHRDLAIISSQPLSFIFSDNNFIVAEMKWSDTPIRIFSVHLPCYAPRPALMDIARRMLRFATTETVIIAGDFNLDPKRPKDKSFFSTLRGILAHANITWLKNSLNTRFPETPEHSAHTLDHIFLSIPRSHLALKITQTDLSDHAILSLTIARVKPERSPLIKHLKAPPNEIALHLPCGLSDTRDYLALVKIIYDADKKAEAGFIQLQKKVEDGLGNVRELKLLKAQKKARANHRDKWPLTFMRPWKGEIKATPIPITSKAMEASDDPIIQQRLSLKQIRDEFAPIFSAKSHDREPLQ